MLLGQVLIPVHLALGFLGSATVPMGLGFSDWPANDLSDGNADKQLGDR